MAVRKIYLDGTVIKFQDDDQTAKDLDSMVKGENTTFADNPYTKDEDDMASDSATHVSSQQAIKAYVDLKSGTDVTSGTPTPTVGNRRNIYSLTALAGNPTFAAPSGTPANGDVLLIRIKDDGTGRTLAWNAIYRSTAGTLPTATTASKTSYTILVYNSTDSKWDCLATGEEA